MATYQHGVYNQEQATSLTTPIRSSAALQVIFGTAPVHLADDPTKAANTPKLCYSFAECQAAVGYSDDFKNFTLCQSIDANFRFAPALTVLPILGNAEQREQAIAGHAGAVWYPHGRRPAGIRIR